MFNSPGSRLPVKVLLRVDANASHMSNVNGFGNDIQNLAQSQKGFVDAYEIGNEPNLDATYGWGHGSTNVPPYGAPAQTRPTRARTCAARRAVGVFRGGLVMAPPALSSQRATRKITRGQWRR